MLDGYAELLSQALEEQCEAYPLNDSQLGVYLACLKEPGSCMYNQPRAYRFEKDGVDPTALAAAAKAAMLNHALLFCAVVQRSGGGVILTRPVQTRKAAFQVEIAEAGEAEMEQKLAEFVRPFDLEHDILVRVRVYVTETGCWLAFDAHHLVCDGVSINILMSETAAAYAGKPLEAEPVSTACLGLFDRKLEEAGVYDRGREFFSEKLGGIETRTMLLPNVLISEDAKKKGNRSMTAELAGAVSAAGVKSFCKEVGVPSYRVGLFFVSAFSYAAAKFIGQEDTVVYIPSHGRNDRRLLKAVGMTVQTLPVVQHIDESRTVSEYVSGAVADAAEAAERGTCPFVRLAPEFDLSADLFVNYQGEWSLRLGEQKAYAMPLTPPDALTPFMLWIFREGDSFKLMAFYEKSLYTPAYVRAFLDFYIHVLREFLNAAGTGRRLCELPLAPAGQLETLRGFNRTERPYDRSKTIIDMFREAAERFPDKTAVVYLDRAYTYRQVDDLSDRIAAYIHSLGVGREDIVSVLIPRCEYMPIASLGVMKAGAAYQPLDPTYPPERLEFMIRDAGAKLLIADEGLRGLVAGYQGPVLFTGEIMDGDGTVLLPPCPDRGALLEWAPAPEDLYILLYTSGTTGQPKGAMLVHRNIANFCHWYHRYYALTERRKVAAYASYGFDANMMDTYPALTIGAELHIIDQDMRLNLAEMSRYFEDNGITDSFITTQVGRTFSLSFPHPTLLHLALSGETLTPLPPSGEYTLHNAYGPTECTIYSTACPILHDYNKVPIGFPLRSSVPPSAPCPTTWIWRS